MCQRQEKIHQELSLEEQFYLIRYCSESPKRSIRNRRCKSVFKVLYQLFLLQKNVSRGRWTDVHTALLTLARYAKLHRNTVKNVINLPGFKIFCEIEHRNGETHLYQLKNWVFDLFVAFERLGMMRGFQNNHNSWFKTFCARADNAFIKMIQKGLTLEQVVNKLSTKRVVKMSGSKPLKMSTTTSYAVTTPSGSRLKTKNGPSIPAYEEFSRLGQTIGVRCKLQAGDLDSIMRRFSLCDIKGGYRVMDDWLKKGMEVKYPPRAFIGAIMQHKESKNSSLVGR